MRRRYQQGSLTKVDGNWIAQWWEDGHRRKRTLGRVSIVKKAEAKPRWMRFWPLQQPRFGPSPSMAWGEFVNHICLPFYGRKWKFSTKETNENRIRVHFMPLYEQRTLGSFSRDELQDLLDAKAQAGLSYSVVAHLRWDLRQVFRMAVQEGHVMRNPAELLFIPRDAKRPEHTNMTLKEVQLCFAVLEPRERLVVKLAVLAGLRPGEILGLEWGRLSQTHADIRQRVYRGRIDFPKTNHSIRKAALAAGVLDDIREWKTLSRDTNDDAWMFPSETGKTPVSRDNLSRRHIGPQLEAADLG